MAKRKRKLLPIDFEKRALARYAKSCLFVGEALSTSYEELPDGRCVAAVRSHGVAIVAYQVNQSRLKKIDLPTEFW